MQLVCRVFAFLLKDLTSPVQSSWHVHLSAMLRFVNSCVRALQEQYAAELEAETDMQNRYEAACAAQQVCTACCMLCCMPFTTKLYVLHIHCELLHEQHFLAGCFAYPY